MSIPGDREPWHPRADAAGGGMVPSLNPRVLGRVELGELWCLRCQSWTPVSRVGVRPPGTGVSTGFKHRAAKSVPAVADPSLPALLGLAALPRSSPSGLLSFPCADRLLHGLSKGHRCSSALPKGLVFGAAASSRFPGRGVYMLPDKSCAERSLLATPAGDCQQFSACPRMSPACKRGSNQSCG